MLETTPGVSQGGDAEITYDAVGKTKHKQNLIVQSNSMAPVIQMECVFDLLTGGRPAITLVVEKENDQDRIPQKLIEQTGGVKIITEDKKRHTHPGDSKMHVFLCANKKVIPLKDGKKSKYVRQVYSLDDDTKK